MSGEHVSLTNEYVLKDRRAFRGFVLPVNSPKRRKLRRQRRDTRKRHRVSKRGKRASRVASIRSTKHWSERKDRRFRNIAFSHRRGGFAKKVARSLCNKSVVRYGAVTYHRKAFNHATSGRLARFIMRARVSTIPTSVFVRAIPEAENLIAMSSLSRRKTATRVRNNRKIAALRYRRQPLTALVRRKERFVSVKREFITRQEYSTARGLVSSVDVVPSITPL